MPSIGSPRVRSGGFTLATTSDGGTALELFANLTSAEYEPGTYARDAEAAGFDGVTCSDHYWLRSRASRTCGCRWPPWPARRAGEGGPVVRQQPVPLARRVRPGQPGDAAPVRRAVRGRARRGLDREGDGGHRPGVPARAACGPGCTARRCSSCRSCCRPGTLPVRGRALPGGRAGRRPAQRPAASARGLRRRAVDGEAHHADRRPGRAEVRADHPRRRARPGGHGHASPATSWPAWSRRCARCATTSRSGCSC